MPQQYAYKNTSLTVLPVCSLHIEGRAFNNYVDIILPFFKIATYFFPGTIDLEE
jgi:hypothetical protein